MKATFQHRRARLGVLASVVVAAGVTIAACQSAPDDHRQEAVAAAPIDVQIGRVEAVDWPSTYEAGGVVRARQTAVISSRVVAPVTEVRVRAGDRVRRGQILVVLDGRELDAQAARATATAASSSLGLEAARAELAAAESAQVLARATFARIKGLHESKSATSQELDQATASQAAADARVAAARARVAEAEQGSAAAKAGAQAADVGASYTRLTAPFDGVVASRQADPGTLAAPGMPLLTLDDAGLFRLEARVDESQAPRLEVGAEVDVRVDVPGADQDRWQRTTVSEVASIDPDRHSFLVKVDLPPGSGGRSGLFGRVRLLGPGRSTLAAPRSSIVQRGQLTFAFVLDGEGRARLRMVSTGESSPERVEVLAGLQDGEQVVLDPPATLEDGRHVRGAGRASTGATK